jgi:hypothetical protein
MKMHTNQYELNYCDLFDIAYAYLLIQNEKPAIFFIDQYSKIFGYILKESYLIDLLQKIYYDVWIRSSRLKNSVVSK